MNNILSFIIVTAALVLIIAFALLRRPGRSSALLGRRSGRTNFPGGSSNPMVFTADTPSHHGHNHSGGGFGGGDSGGFSGGDSGSF